MIPVLTCIAGGRTHALALGEVIEIARPRGWTRVPNAPASLLGMVNLRGAALPIVSLAALVGPDAARSPAAPTAEGGDAGRVVVMQLGARFGLLVDAVGAVGEADPLDLGPLLARDFAVTARRTARAVKARPAQPEAATPAQPAHALLGVSLAGQDYAFRLEDVLAVLPRPKAVARVAGADAAMLGVTDHAGQPLPLLSLAALLGLSSAADAGGAVVVVRLGEAAAGLLVEAARAVWRVAEADIAPVPPVLTRGRAEARVAGICRLDGGARLVCLLSPASLLDAASTARLLAHRSVPDLAAEPAAAARFLVLRIGAERYGVPLAAVQQVARRPRHLTRLPRAPSFVAGVMNLRGRAVPVIDQARRFATTAGLLRSIVVVHIGGVVAGFAVDAVDRILDISISGLQPPPDAAGSVFDGTAIAPDGQPILLIDPQTLLDGAQRDLLAAMALDAA